MLNKLWDWYADTPLGWRRFFLAILVPVQEYIFLEPYRKLLNLIAKFSPYLAIALVPTLLFMGLLTAIVIVLFIYEFLLGIGNKIKNKSVGYVFHLCVMGWVLLPIRVLRS
jgi:hypothetical protein